LYPPQGRDQGKGLEIVIGGWANSRSAIRNPRNGWAELASRQHSTPPLNVNEWRTFWLLWEIRRDGIHGLRVGWVCIIQTSGQL
jgi:hypothetical protein